MVSTWLDAGAVGSHIAPIFFRVQYAGRFNCKPLDGTATINSPARPSWRHSSLQQRQHELLQRQALFFFVSFSEIRGPWDRRIDVLIGLIRGRQGAADIIRSPTADGASQRFAHGCACERCSWCSNVPPGSLCGASACNRCSALSLAEGSMCAGAWIFRPVHSERAYPSPDIHSNEQVCRTYAPGDHQGNAIVATSRSSALASACRARDQFCEMGSG